MTYAIKFFLVEMMASTHFEDRSCNAFHGYYYTFFDIYALYTYYPSPFEWRLTFYHIRNTLKVTVIQLGEYYKHPITGEKLLGPSFYGGIFSILVLQVVKSTISSHTLVQEYQKYQKYWKLSLGNFSKGKLHFTYLWFALVTVDLPHV